MIRDKQELKRCVKQAVRRAQVTETDFAYDVMNGGLGVSQLLETWAPPAGAPNDAFRRASAQGTPFLEGAATMFAALGALELPTHNLNNAQTIQQSYDRNAYLREVLDAMRARRVLVRIPADRAAQAVFDDERFVQMIAVDGASFFKPGRYGVNYEERAAVLVQLLEQCDSRDLLAENTDLMALRCCLIPVGEDTGCVLHLHVDADEMDAALALLKAHPKAHTVISGCAECERELISLAQGVPNVLVRLCSLENMRYALATLNTRFIPFAACASLPEQMLGRWENAREAIWQTLLEAYLPLARAGYELSSEAIARDVAMLFSGHLDALYEDSI